MTDSNICGYCGGDKDIAKIAKRMGHRPDVAFAQLAKAEQRIEQLEASARYHAIEVGCECLDCYQIREAEQYVNGRTEND